MTFSSSSTSSKEPRPPAIALEKVGVLRASRWLVRDVSWALPRGACAAILGPNGSGKSTLARVICGYLWASSGHVRVDGKEFGQIDLNELRTSIRLVQSAGPYDAPPELTMREVVLTGAYGTIGLYNDPTPQQRVQADRFIARVGMGRQIDQTYGTLSSGERMRALIARALMGAPKLLLLDEPTAGLDLLAREQVLASVEALFEPAAHEPPTVVIITHHVEELPPATSQVLLMDNGTIAGAGTPRQVLNSDLLSKVYQCPLHVNHRDGRWSVHVEPGAWRRLLD